MTPLTALTNLHFVDDQYAWAIGKSGHIYHTADGGQRWERQLGERQDNLRDVLFLNESHGWIAGENGTLLETQNGGQTWTSLASGTRQPLIGVHFADVRGLNPRTSGQWGWAMRRDGVVIYTTDGKKWSTGKPAGASAPGGR